MRKKTLSQITDFIVLLSALLFSVIGKDLSKMIFKDVAYSYGDFSYLTTVNLVIIFLSSLAFISIQLLSSDTLFKGFSYAVAGFTSSVIVLIASALPSMMIFFCQILIFAVCSFCFLFRPYLSYNMKDEFWKVVFESLIKIIQLSLIVYVAVIATLRFVHETDGSYLGFSSTIFYPTIIYLFMLFMFGYWVVYPVWVKLLHCYKGTSD